MPLNNTPTKYQGVCDECGSAFHEDDKNLFSFYVGVAHAGDMRIPCFQLERRYCCSVDCSKKQLLADLETLIAEVFNQQAQLKEHEKHLAATEGSP